MTYTIRYRKDGEITHQDLWNGPLERAQEIAAKAVADGTLSMLRYVMKTTNSLPIIRTCRIAAKKGASRKRAAQP